MMLVKIKPLAPTNAPATMRTLLSITKPAAHAASPEKLFKRAITTGISAPPIGITNKTPKINAKPINSKSVCSELIKPCTNNMFIPTSKMAKRRIPFTNCCPL